MLQPRLTIAILVFLLLIFNAPTARAQPATAPADATWTNADTLPLINAGFDDADRYARLPDRYRDRLREPVWNLSRHASGIAVRFASSATAIHARWRTGPASMPHMADNAVRGLDLYTLTDDGARYLGTGRVSDGTDHESTLVAGLSPKRRDFVLYLPLYEHLESLELRGADGASVEPPTDAPDADPFFRRPPIVVYGTSIAQGACASRPGMAWPAIVSRALRREFINLGFSGNGRLDLPLADALAEIGADIGAAAYIIDCLPNLDPAGVATRTEPFVSALLDAHPTTPIVLVENPRYPGASDRPALRRLIDEKNAALRAAHRSLRAAYPDAIIELVTLEDLAPDADDLTADGIHPTDAGMRAHADRLAQTLRPLLGDR